MSIFNVFRFRIRLQRNSRNQVIMMHPNPTLNKVLLKWKLHGEWNSTANAWETSVPPELDHFPFTGNVSVKVTFRNDAGLVEVILKFII